MPASAPTPIRPGPTAYEQRGYYRRQNGDFVCPHCSAVIENWVDHENWHIDNEPDD